MRIRINRALFEALESRKFLAGGGLQAEYFNNNDLTSLAVTRTDATVNFDWGNSSPASQVGPTDYSARWTGQVQPQYSQAYTFYTKADDGVRLWVNGQLLINRWSNRTIGGDCNGDGAVDTADFNTIAANWGKPASASGGDANGDGLVDSSDFNVLTANFGQSVAPQENSGTITLQAGQKYDIKLEYYNKSGMASAKLLWSSASQPKGVIASSNLYAPGSSGQTYNYVISPGQSISSVRPSAGQWVDVLPGTYGAFSFPASGVAGNQIHYRFEPGAIVSGNGGNVIVQGGQYLDIQGMTVQNANNGLQAVNAAVKISTGTTLSDSTIKDVSGVGLAISGSAAQVLRTTFLRCGEEAFIVQMASNVLISDSTILYSNNGLANPVWKSDPNARLINGLYYVNPDWEAGGNKLWNSTNVTIQNTESAYNVGPGFWEDYRNSNTKYINVYSHNNRGLDSSRSYQGEGIRLELSSISAGALVQNSRFENNSGAGVTIDAIHNVTISGNRFNDKIGVLFRNDDTRGDIQNVTITGNTFAGAMITTWGSKFAMVNIITSPNTYL